MLQKQRKKKKVPDRRSEKNKRKEKRKVPDQRSEENRRNIQKGIWTRQYLNNTELSPNETKNEGKETTT